MTDGCDGDTITSVTWVFTVCDGEMTSLTTELTSRLVDTAAVTVGSCTDVDGETVTSIPVDITFVLVLGAVDSSIEDISVDVTMVTRETATIVSAEIIAVGMMVGCCHDNTVDKCPLVGDDVGVYSIVSQLRPVVQMGQLQV